MLLIGDYLRIKGESVHANAKIEFNGKKQRKNARYKYNSFFGISRYFAENVCKF